MPLGDFRAVLGPIPRTGVESVRGTLAGGVGSRESPKHALSSRHFPHGGGFLGRVRSLRSRPGSLRRSPERRDAPRS